jgi:hypothetical protein
MYESYDESSPVTKLVKVESHVCYVYVFNNLNSKVPLVIDWVIWVGMQCVSTVGYYRAFTNLAV